MVTNPGKGYSIDVILQMLFFFYIFCEIFYHLDFFFKYHVLYLVSKNSSHLSLVTVIYTCNVNIVSHQDEGEKYFVFSETLYVGSD